MIESDKASFAELMVGYGEMYNKAMTKSLMRVYFSALQRYSLEQVEYGLGIHSQDSKHGTFMPKPADIIRHIDAGQPSVDDRAEIAWMQIVNAMSRTGAYGRLQLDDKQALAAVKNMGSWQSLCHTDLDKLQWKKKEFMDLYQNFETTPIEMLPSHLPGIEDMAAQKKEAGGNLAGLLEKMNARRLENK